MHNYTIKDYFRHETFSWDKSEFCKGQILAMPGTTSNHALIAFNLAFELRTCMKKNDKDCYTYLNDVKFYIPLFNLATYPDLMIVCGEPEYYKGKEEYVILNPTLVVEVLSKSTQKFDFETKLPCYLTVDSVKTVMLIDQYSKKIYVYEKGKEAEYKTYSEGKFNVMDCELDVNEIYYKVKIWKKWLVFTVEIPINPILKYSISWRNGIFLFN